jgi:hypothetical protein
VIAYKHPVDYVSTVETNPDFDDGERELQIFNTRCPLFEQRESVVPPGVALVRQARNQATHTQPFAAQRYDKDSRPHQARTGTDGGAHQEE